MKYKKCLECKRTIVVKSNAQKYCKKCAAIVRKTQINKAVLKYWDKKDPGRVKRRKTRRRKKIYIYNEPEKLGTTDKSGEFPKMTRREWAIYKETRSQYKFLEDEEKISEAEEKGKPINVTKYAATLNDNVSKYWSIDKRTLIRYVTECYTLDDNGNYISIRTYERDDEKPEKLKKLNFQKTKAWIKEYEKRVKPYPRRMSWKRFINNYYLPKCQGNN